MLRYASRIAPDFGLVGLGPLSVAYCVPPQQQAALHEQRQIFRRLTVRNVSCHSAGTFSSARNSTARIPEAWDDAVLNGMDRRIAPRRHCAWQWGQR